MSESIEKKKIATLPRPAQVAFAARCSRRVQPLISKFWVTRPDEVDRVVERCIRWAEQGASQRVPAEDRGAHAALVKSIGERAMEAVYEADEYAAANEHVVGSRRGNDSIAAHAINAARYTCDAYETFLEFEIASISDLVADAALHAIESVRIFDAYSRMATGGPVLAVVSAMQRDIELLSVAAEAEGWVHETPVPIEFFGPLWPEGEPDEWPEEGQEERAGDEVFSVTLDVPADVSEDEIESIVRELSVRLDECHVAEGGRGVVIDSVDLPRRATMPVGVSP